MSRSPHSCYMMYHYIIYVSFICFTLFRISASNCCEDQSTATKCSGAYNDKGHGCHWIAARDTTSLAISEGIQCVPEQFWECDINGINCPTSSGTATGSGTTSGTGSTTGSGTATGDPSATTTSTPNTRSPPTCSFASCPNTRDAMNIQFVLDESDSVGARKYKMSLDFVEKMVINDITAKSRLSMLAFASGVDRIYHFSDPQGAQRTALLKELTAEARDYNGGITCMAPALAEAINEYTATPDISPTDDNLLFLMTNGEPNCGGNVCDLKASLDAAGITLYIIVVSRQFEYATVECLVDSDYSRIFTVDTYDAALFWQLESELRDVVCPSNRVEMAMSEKFREIDAPRQEAENHILLLCVAIIGVTAAVLCYFCGRYSLNANAAEIRPILSETKHHSYDIHG